MTRSVVYGVGLILTMACKLEMRPATGLQSNTCRHGNDYREYRHAAMGQLHAGTLRHAARTRLPRVPLTQYTGWRAQVLVRPPQPLLSGRRHMRSIPEDERLYKGPVLLQYVADSWLLDLFCCRHRALHTGIICGHHRRRRTKEDCWLASCCRCAAV
jgi:hypothetical protein